MKSSRRTRRSSQYAGPTSESPTGPQIRVTSWGPLFLDRACPRRSTYHAKIRHLVEWLPSTTRQNIVQISRGSRPSEVGRSWDQNGPANSSDPVS